MSQAHRNDWLNVHAASERRFARALRGFFDEQRNRLKDSLADFDTLTPSVAPQLLDVEAETAAMVSAVEPVLGELIATGAERVMRQRPAKATKATARKDFDVELSDFDIPQSMWMAIEAAFTHLTEQDYWRDIQQGTLLSITDTLQHAIDEGLSVPNMRDALMANHADMSEWRARAIARTETTGSLNSGHDASYRSLQGEGDIEAVEWLAILDSDTRASHAEANGQTKSVGGEFTVGGVSCQYPGDAGLPAAERCNCRCTTAAVWVE